MLQPLLPCDEECRRLAEERRKEEEEQERERKKEEEVMRASATAQTGGEVSISAAPINAPCTILGDKLFGLLHLCAFSCGDVEGKAG